MHGKSAFFLALVALTAQVALAKTPACLIEAVNEQPDPSNMQAVCSGSNATAVTSYVCENCGADIQAALSDFEGGCLGAGLTISTEDACSSEGGTSSDSLASTDSGQNGGASSTATTTGDSGATASPSQAAGGAEGSNAAIGVGVVNGGVTAALLFAALVAW